MDSAMSSERFQVLLVLLSSLAHLTASNGIEDGCFYYYIRQPLYDPNCNPWSLVTNTSTLPLYCHIQAPKNDDLPNIEWFRWSENETIRVNPGRLSSPKYTNPISSRDGTDFKFVNFSLVIHDISDSDVGCYYCEINVATEDDCSFDIRPSTRFCLMEEGAYSGSADCVSVPVNDEKVCAVNETCMHSPNLNLPVQTTPGEMSSVVEPTSVFFSTESVTSSRELESSSEQMTQLSADIMESQSLTNEKSPSLSSSKLDTESPSETQPIMNSISPSLKTLSQSSISSSLQPSTQDTASSQVLMSSKVSKISVRSTKPPPSQQQLRIGLYIGVGVCCLLLVVILVLLAAVAVLCKAPSVRRQRKEAVLPSSVSPEPLNNTVWNRPQSSTSTFLVNDRSVHLLPPTPSTSSTLPAGTNDRGQTGDLAPGHHGSLAGPLPSMKRDKTDRDAHVHHRLSLINQLEDDGHVTAQGTTPPHSHSGSPESHYYHVLEQPRYYNFNWLASDPEGRELLMQNWRDGDTTTTTGRQSTHYQQKNENHQVAAQFEGQEARLQVMEDELESYHWKITPPPPVKGKKGEGGSPRRQKRQLYTRLDCRKMEPRREYARVSVKKTSSSEELQREE